MAFPRNPNDSIPQTGSNRRRRNNRRRQQQADSRRQLPARINLEQRRQRIAIGIGAAILVIIFAIVGVGYYIEFYRPPRVVAGEVRDAKFTMGDLVDRIRILQGINRYQGGFVDLSTVPFEILQSMLNAEIVRQAAPGLGISVTQADIDEFIRGQFYQEPPAGQETDPGQLEREFQERYRNFLTSTNLSASDYRVIVEEEIMQQQLRAFLAAGIEDSQEQIEVEWIRIDPEAGVDPNEVKQRLEFEEFADVAVDVGVSEGFANEEGYVGWVPRGAFPNLDNALFGNPEEEVEPVPLGEISDPVILQGGTYIIRRISGPEERDVSDLMFSKLSTERVSQWSAQQQRRGSDEGWLKINFDSERYAWVADQVRVTAPRTTPVPQQQQPMGP